MYTCGEQIAKLRKKRDFTQEELAYKIGITRAALSHYETNKREPDYATIERFADFFHVSVDYLIGRTDQRVFVLDEDLRQFVDSLELSDQKIFDMFTLTVDGKKLTPDEAVGFIHFIRKERSNANTNKRYLN